MRGKVDWQELVFWEGERRKRDVRTGQSIFGPAFLGSLCFIKAAVMFSSFFSSLCGCGCESILCSIFLVMLLIYLIVFLCIYSCSNYWNDNSYFYV